MTTPILGSVAAVKRITGFATEQIDEQTILDFLAEADRNIRATHYNKYMLDLYYATTIDYTGVASLSYSTYFPIKSATTVEVWVNGVLRTLTTDYTVSNSTITFTSAVNLCPGDKINIYYTPEFFDDYVNYIAASRIASMVVVDSSNGVMLQNVQHITETVKRYERMIASKPHVAKSVDSSHDQSIW